MKKIISIISALIFNSIMGAFLAGAAGISPIGGAAGMNVLGVLAGVVGMPEGLREGVLTEV